ncbi:hypothetical protein ACJ41O_009295 [Fusarium nematophilum]
MSIFTPKFGGNWLPVTLETSEGLQLAIGSAQGVAVGATFEVFPGSRDPKQLSASEVFASYNRLLPEVRVTKVFGLRSLVELVAPHEEIPEVKAAFNVVLDEKDEFVIQDENEHQIQEAPTLPQRNKNSIETWASVLRHLARFRAIARAEYSPNRGTLAPNNFSFHANDWEGSPPRMDPLGSDKVVETESFSGLIENHKDRRGYFTVFSLDPTRWSIQGIYPGRDFESTRSLTSRNSAEAFKVSRDVLSGISQDFTEETVSDRPQNSAEEIIRAYIYVGDSPPS